MELEIIAIYCWCELILNQLNIKDDCRTEMTHAEVLTTAIVAVRFFSGNFQNACNFLSEHDYILKMLSKSRFNRRLHKLVLNSLEMFRKLSEKFLSLQIKTKNMQLIASLYLFVKIFAFFIRKFTQKKNIVAIKPVRNAIFMELRFIWL